MTDRVELTPEQRRKIVEAIQVAESLQQQMDDLEACGESCQLRRQKLAVTRQRLQTMLERFSPK